MCEYSTTFSRSLSKLPFSHKLQPQCFSCRIKATSSSTLYACSCIAMALTPFLGRELNVFDPSSDKFWDPFSFFENAPTRQLAKDASAVANTRVDWLETSDAHVLKADLPGLSKEEVKIQIEDGNTLSISGERQKEETQSTDKWHRVERSYGSFLRKFRLPKDSKVDEIKARVENGVLEVTIPKAQQTKPESRTVDIA